MPNNKSNNKLNNRSNNMKRFLTIILAVCAFFAASAQYPLVTLSHNGELSFFDNLYAFESAYNAAENGDTIFLSKGEFVLNGGAFTIKKRLSVVGNGYDSNIVGNIYINMKDNSDSVMDAPLFDGVRLDELVFSVYDPYNSSYYTLSPKSRDNLGETEIRRCWIKYLSGAGYAGTKVTIDKCYLEKVDFFGIEDNVVVKNSKFNGRTDDYMYGITAINCNISLASCYPRTMISCIFQKFDHGDPNKNGSHSIINSVLDFNPTVYTHDCYIKIYDPENPLLDDNLDCPLNLEELGYLGQDGTVVGIYGGESPFSESPSVPTVDTEKSSVDYDAENNKLKVSITVKAD